MKPEPFGLTCKGWRLRKGVSGARPCLPSHAKTRARGLLSIHISLIVQAFLAADEDVGLADEVIEPSPRKSAISVQPSRSRMRKREVLHGIGFRVCTRGQIRDPDAISEDSCISGDITEGHDGLDFERKQVLVVGDLHAR